MSTTISEKISIIVLPNITIYKDGKDEFYMKDMKDEFVNEYNENSECKEKIYKPDMITEEDENDIIIPYILKTKKFSALLDRIEYIQDCNDIKENGPEARYYNRRRRHTRE